MAATRTPLPVPLRKDVALPDDPRASNEAGQDARQGDPDLGSAALTADDPQAARPQRRLRGRAARYADRDLTTGSVPRHLWSLSWPQMVGGIFGALDQITDLFWAGLSGGFAAIGGLGAAQAYARIVTTGRNGLDLAMQAMLTRAIGAGRRDLVNRIVLQALMLNGVIASVLAVVGIFTSAWLLRVIGLSETVVEAAVVYLQLQFVGSVGQAFRQSTAHALMASGDVITPMKSTMAMRVIHLGSSPVLVFGLFGAPEMGIAGAAAANIVAQVLGGAWNLRVLMTGSPRLVISLGGIKPDFPVLWQLLKIGAPAAATQMERGISEVVVTWLVAPFGDAALAAHSLTRRVERLFFLGGFGLGRASGILVGHNLGAGKPERAKSTVKWAMVLMFAFRGGGALLLILFTGTFIGLFSGDREFLVVAILWVQIHAVAGVFQGTGQVLRQSFNIAGDTIAPLLITFVSLWTLEIPLAVVLSRFTPLEQYGIPVAILIAMVVRMGLFGGYFATGRWLRVQVLGQL